MAAATDGWAVARRLRQSDIRARPWDASHGESADDGALCAWGGRRQLIMSGNKRFEEEFSRGGMETLSGEVDLCIAIPGSKGRHS
eukprot:scaffold910_cov396-Prasinococcus_capsulatus_cf.AAC.69